MIYTPFEASAVILYLVLWLVGEWLEFSIFKLPLQGNNVKISFFLASCSLGAAQASIVQAAEHAKVRKQFDTPLAENQVQKNKITSIGLVILIK